MTPPFDLSSSADTYIYTVRFIGLRGASAIVGSAGVVDGIEVFPLPRTLSRVDFCFFCHELHSPA